MTDRALFNELGTLVRSIAKLDDQVPMTPETRMVDDLGVDSLDLVSVYLEIQDRYDVAVAEDDLPEIKTLGELTDYVAARRSVQAA